MGFLGGGDSPDIPPAPEIAPPQKTVLPEVEKAEADLRERLRRSRSRAMSRVTAPGMFEEVPTQRPALLSNRIG
jgi:hypothetical protein